MKYFALLLMAFGLPFVALSQDKLESLKKEVREKIDGNAKMAQVMVDKVFSFSELGV